ncbi:MAG UNVERIFIED_CONTAM: hypothetical protein LVR18_46815 [Planctomycetaceae bacterium]|jgi:hypothetical protein
MAQDQTQTWTLAPQLLGIEAAGTLSLHIGNGQPGKPTGTELGQFDGALSIEVSANGITAFLFGQMKLGPADARLLTLQTVGVFSASDDGLALDIKVSSAVGVAGPLAGVFSLTVNGRLVLNTTSKDVDVDLSDKLLSWLPEDYKSTLPAKSATDSRKVARIPAGPPRKNDANGPAGAYLVAALDGQLVIGGTHSIQGSTRFELTSTSISVDISGTLSMAPIAGVAVDGTLQIRRNGLLDTGVVGALQLAAGINFGPVKLTAFAQFEINTTQTNAVIDRYTFNYATNTRSDTTVTATLPGGTRRLYIDGNAIIEDVVRFSGSFETTSQLSGRHQNSCLGKWLRQTWPHGQDVLSLGITGLFYWHNTDFAFRIKGNSGINLPGLKIAATLDVSMNTSSKEITYTVPEPTKTLAGISTFTITAGPPLLGGGSGAAAPYVVAMGTGKMTLVDLVDLNGEFRFEISTTKVDVFVGATVVLGPFGSAGVSGNFQVGTSGAAGSLSVAINGEFRLSEWISQARSHSTSTQPVPRQQYVPST